MTVLFENGIANGNSPNIHTSEGGNHVFSVRGNFNGATVTVQLFNPDDPNIEWADVENGALTFASDKSIDFVPQGYQVRAVISSAGASTDIFAGVRT